MIKNILLTTAIFVSIGAAAQTRSYNERVQQYIRQYQGFAKAEQQRSGVPAAITLSQGILETEAGNSELATLANNHFGIKCKKEWIGETFAHDDDAPQECFRKYPTAWQSYKDHSDYLKSGKRYQSCFAQSPTDYASWARELRKCGYATNPKYAQKLIKIIEDFHLQDYTYAALNMPEQPLLIASDASPVAAAMMTEKPAPGEVVPEHDTPAGDDKPVYGKVIHKNGIKGFYARKGDVLLEYAIQFRVRYAKLLEINSLPDAPLDADMFVSLEKGSRITRIISRDASSPALAAAYTPPVNEAVTQEQPASERPVAVAIEKPSTNNHTDEDIAGVKTYRPDDYVNAIEKPASSMAIPEKSKQPVAVTTAQVNANVPKTAVTVSASNMQPVQEPARPVEKPVNIANEVAVEEMKPAVKEEPQDEFSRLKARFDKVVYATAKKPASTQVAAPSVTEKPAPPVLASAVDGKKFHTVKSGETAFGIAKQYGITMKELMALNGLNFEAIKIGQKLRVK